jgi:quercetin dioxygenase-like cupin family protein
MKEAYFFTADIHDLISVVPPDTIVSRTFYENDQLKAILFGFAQGQELSEHTSSKPAILHFLEGEADLTLGEDIKSVKPGSWAFMTPNLPHSIVAKNQVVMLLYLL